MSDLTAQLDELAHSEALGKAIGRRVYILIKAKSHIEKIEAENAELKEELAPYRSRPMSDLEKEIIDATQFVLGAASAEGWEEEYNRLFKLLERAAPHIEQLEAENARLKAENEQIQLAVAYKRFTVEDTVTGKQLKWWGAEARGENNE